MSSPKFIAAIATDIIQACDDVSLVTFGVTNSAYEHSLGLMPGGDVKLFDCLEPTEPNMKLTWGQTFCP